jgi:hypothetical protein
MTIENKDRLLLVMVLACQIWGMAGCFGLCLALLSPVAPLWLPLVSLAGIVAAIQSVRI